MKRYRFSLESALRARRAQEDVARQRLAGANARVQEAQALHDAALAAYRAVTLCSSPADRESFMASRAREMRMAESVERAHHVVAERQVEAISCYAAWVDAAQKVASLERLEERRRAEWELEARRDEAATVDDLVTARWWVADPPTGPDQGRRSTLAGGTA